MKTNSLSKTQLVVWTNSSFCCHLRETYVKTKKRRLFYETKMQKARFETLKIKIL